MFEDFEELSEVDLVCPATPADFYLVGDNLCMSICIKFPFFLSARLEFKFSTYIFEIFPLFIFG